MSEQARSKPWRGWPLGVLMSALLLVNTLVWSLPLMVGALLKLLLPFAATRRPIARFLDWTCAGWAAWNRRFVLALLPTRWLFELPEDLRPQGQYIAFGNHRSSVDVVAMICAFSGRAPFFRFFLKRELIFVPILGLAWWALDYPFMKRHSRAALARRPELRDEDLATARRACARFVDLPVLIVNFVEGTRYSEAKRQAQAAPYRHLLKPRAGGLALALASFSGCIDSLLDITIGYPSGTPGLWALLSGRVAEVRLRAERVFLPPELGDGDYQGDAAFRARFQAWLAERWARKDALLDSAGWRAQG